MVLNKPQNLIEKKCLLLDFQPTQLLCFFVWILPLYTSFQVSIQSKFSKVASINCGVTQWSTEFSLMGESLVLAKPKISHFAHLEIPLLEDSLLPPSPHQIFIPPPPTKG